MQTTPPDPEEHGPEPWGAEPSDDLRRDGDVPVAQDGEQGGLGEQGAQGGPGDRVQDDEGVTGGRDPLRFSQWMKRSATGAVLSGIAIGLQQALETKRQQPAFVMEAPGEPEDPDAPITLHFDPDDPTKTVAVIRSAKGNPPPPGPTSGTGTAQTRDRPGPDVT